MARSTDAGMEGLKATDSSPSVLPGAPEDEDDLGLYNVPYSEGYWIYIDSKEEIQVWTKPDACVGNHSTKLHTELFSCAVGSAFCRRLQKLFYSHR